MSKVIPIALASSLAAETTSFAYLWLVTRRDGQVFGFTSHDVDITVDGQVYKARQGFDGSQISTSGDFAVDNMKVSGFLNSDAVTEYDVLTRKWDYAQVRLSRCDWKNPAGGVEKLRIGRLGEVSTSKFGFQAELLGLMQALQQPVGRIYMAECDANLGDARCKVNLATFTRTGTVTSVISNAAFADSTRTEADDWFTYGVLTWSSGANAGLAMEVKGFTQANGAFELAEMMAGLISVGDMYSVYAGCNKLRGVDCLNKFSNTINHRGFPSKPTQDRLVSGN